MTQTTAPLSVRPAATTTHGFAIAAALTLAFGAFVLPIVGWFVGAVLICLSALWTTREKTLAIVVPPALAISAAVVVALAGGGSSDAVANPLIPTSYDLLWMTGLLAGVVLIPASGIWLLWRARGRAAARPAAA